MPIGFALAGAKLGRRSSSGAPAFPFGAAVGQHNAANPSTPHAPQTTLTIGQRNIRSVIIYDDDRGKEFGNSAAIEVQAIARDDQAGLRDQQIPRSSLGSR